MEAKTLKYSKAEEKKHLNVRARLSHMAPVRDPLCCFKNELTPHSSVGHTCLLLKFLLWEAAWAVPIPTTPDVCVLLPEHGVHVSSGSPEVDTNDTLTSKKIKNKKVQTQPTLVFLGRPKRLVESADVWICTLLYYATYLAFLHTNWRLDPTSKQATVQKSHICFFKASSQTQRNCLQRDSKEKNQL